MRRWTVDVTLHAVSAAQQELCAHLDSLGVQGRASFVINMVYEEAALNLVDHAVHGRTSTFDLHLVHVVYATTITIEDDFAPFDPIRAPIGAPPATLLEHDGRGLGIKLMTDMADELRYERVCERNRLSATVLHR
ncbi:MAG: ATP-binding protein [Actinomycetota bacterium]